MPLSSLKSLKALGARLRWDSQNVQVSSNNLARSGIPGEKAKKLEPFNFRQVLTSSRVSKARHLNTTHSGHISNTKSSAPYQEKEERNRKADTTVSKNNIDPHSEMMAINESNTHFQQSSALYKKMVQNYKLFLSVSK